MKAIDYKNNLNGFLDSYKYQHALTTKLNDLSDTNFDQPLINEIMLWKINRYASLDNKTLRNIDNLKTLINGQHRKGQSVLESLLNISGIDLPMASTILRFRNPKVFQIIDRHAYRAVYGQKYPFNRPNQVDQKISTYFDYLDKLIELCKAKRLDFQTIDRLLYKFDKEKNGKL
jgi:hypothetical protein